MKKSWILSIVFCLILAWVDQFTKYIFYDLGIWSQFSILHPIMNDWISFWIQIPMAVILIISVICIWFFCVLFQKKYLSVLDFSLLLAGTIWNLIDRIMLGSVRDFICLWSFPVFNVADMFLTCGVAWICIKEIFHLQNKKKNLR